MDKVLFKEKHNTFGKKEEKPKVGGVVRFFISLGFVALSIFLLFNSFRAFQIKNSKLQILAQAQSEVTDLRLENIKLILEKSNIETNDYLETDIRNRLNYSKSNEIVFVITDLAKQEAEIKVKNILEPPVEEKVTLKVWQEWVNFLIYEA
ncbi:septum formation initiator family protein [Candidatus Dojkabacteria bacterium]|jgi:cell division protein FtsB|nr:septum formation initiator family protein [Candidatus Dojkabacteria bacterium]